MREGDSGTDFLVLIEGSARVIKRKGHRSGTIAVHAG